MFIHSPGFITNYDAGLSPVWHTDVPERRDDETQRVPVCGLSRDGNRDQTARSWSQPLTGDVSDSARQLPRVPPVLFQQRVSPALGTELVFRPEGSATAGTPVGDELLGTDPTIGGPQYPLEPVSDAHYRHEHAPPTKTYGYDRKRTNSGRPVVPPAVFTARQRIPSGIRRRIGRPVEGAPEALRCSRRRRARMEGCQRCRTTQRTTVVAGPGLLVFLSGALLIWVRILHRPGENDDRHPFGVALLMGGIQNVTVVSFSRAWRARSSGPPM